jgi:hypothetical protein
MTKPRSFAPIIAAVLLLGPVLYVGSYLSLFDSRWQLRNKGVHEVWADGTPVDARTGPYRLGGTVVERFFWPLEQVDRRLRPEHWEEVLISE